MRAGDQDVWVERAADGLWSGSLGWTVRCTPRRRTAVAVLPNGSLVFGKLRHGRRRDARRESRWLRDLPALGFRVPELVARRKRGRHSLICTRGLPGRPLDVLLHGARRPEDVTRAARYLVDAVAPVVERLHGAGLVFRDLYCNHLFARGFDDGEPALLDVERVFRPRFRRRRWHVKDLAGLCASAPATVSGATRLRFLRAYLGGLQGDWKGLATAILRKAARIRSHRPKYG